MPSSPWKHPALLVNAGSRSGPAWMDRARQTLEAQGLSLMSAELVGGGELRNRLRFRMEQGADLLIVGGGDGTLRLAAEELHGSDVTLGVLPLGTGNNFARDLHLPLRLSDACAALVHGESRAIELGEAEFADGTRAIFVNAAHVGLFGMANPQMSPELKRRYKRFAYLVGAWRAYRAFAPFHLTLTSGEITKRWDVFQVSAILGRVYAGGVGAIPGETLQDRRMTVTVLEVDYLLRIASVMWRIARSRHAGPARSHRFRLKEAHLDSDPPMEVNLDGEMLGMTPVTFRVLPHALRVVVGEEPDPAPFRFDPRYLAGGAALGYLAGTKIGKRWRDGS